MRHLGGHQQESDAWRTLAQWIGLWSLTDAAMFGVVEKASGEWIGRIGPWHPLHWPTREVGWGLRKAYWGKGYALEAAAASLDYAFDELGWDSVTHLIADENVMSQKLAARLGSKPGEYVNLPGSLSDVRSFERLEPRIGPVGRRPRMRPRNLVSPRMSVRMRVRSLGRPPWMGCCSVRRTMGSMRAGPMTASMRCRRSWWRTPSRCRCSSRRSTGESCPGKRSAETYGT